MVMGIPVEVYLAFVGLVLALLWVDGGDFCPHRPRHRSLEECNQAKVEQRDA